jgi:hypothetical protein
MRKSLWTIFASTRGEMRKLVFLALLACSFVLVPEAKADGTCTPGDTCTNYTFNFTSNQGDIATSGTLEYDSTNPSVTASIVWEGQTFDFSDANLIGGIINPPFTGCTGTAEALAFNVLNGCAGTMNWFGDNFYGADYLQLYVIQGQTCGSAGLGIAGYACYDGFAPALTGLNVPYSGGTFTLSGVDPVTTPEPTSLSLLLLGFGLVFVMRKRNGQVLPQAS